MTTPTSPARPPAGRAPALRGQAALEIAGMCEGLRIDPSWLPLVIGVIQRDYPGIWPAAVSAAVTENARQRAADDGTATTAGQEWDAHDLAGRAILSERATAGMCRVTGTVTSLDGVIVAFGVDYDAIVIGRAHSGILDGFRFPRSALADVLRCLLAADSAALVNSDQMDPADRTQDQL